MRLRKVGTFQYKGSSGLYVEAVDIARDQPRYAAIEYGQMDETESRALDRGQVIESTILDRGQVIESTILDLDPEGWLHHRLEDCHR
jgi:hypothetical protein